MLKWIKRLCAPTNKAPPGASPSNIEKPKPHQAKPAPASLDNDYLEQLRIYGGHTVAMADDEMLLDLVDWGYLEKGDFGKYTVTTKGKAALQDRAWSPHPDPRIDR